MKAQKRMKKKYFVSKGFVLAVAKSIWTYMIALLPPCTGREASRVSALPVATDGDV